MYGMIGVDADAAMHMHDGMRHPMPGFGGPEPRGGDVDVGWLGALPACQESSATRQAAWVSVSRNPLTSM